MIDTSTWKEFKISDLFGTAKLGKYHNPKDLQEDDNGYEYICASNFNNGVNLNMPRVKGKNLSLTDEHIIAWGKQCPCFSYHKDSCVTSQGMYYYPVGTISELSALFLCSCFQSLCKSKGYGYNDCLTGVTMDNEAVKLPATSNGQPDWDYMESYMKAVMEKSEKALSILKKADDTKHLIDVSGWGEFDITELFDMSLPKGDLQVKKVDDGDIPLITPSNFNNGMIQRISEHSKSTLYDKGSLTVDMFGNAYYQDKNFFVTAHGHVNVLIPKMALNVYTGTFLASTIRTMFFDKYGFNEMCTQKVLKTESIWLPITSTGEPDWQYMEDYMKRVLKKAGESVKDLRKAIINSAG